MEFDYVRAEDAPFPFKCCHCGSDFDNFTRKCVPLSEPIEYDGVAAICSHCLMQAFQDLQMGYPAARFAEVLKLMNIFAAKLAELKVKLEVIHDELGFASGLTDVGHYTSVLNSLPDLSAISMAVDKTTTGDHSEGNRDIELTLDGIFGNESPRNESVVGEGSDDSPKPERSSKSKQFK